jgi:hypothetical protein
MPDYICWTKYEERGVILEEDEEEEEGDDDNMIFYDFAEYSAFDDTAMGELKKRWRQKMSLLMILVSPSIMHRENAKVIRRRLSLCAC